MGEHRVHALEVLKDQSRAEEAKGILTRVAKQVCVVGWSPIGWNRGALRRLTPMPCLPLNQPPPPLAHTDNKGGAPDGQVQVAGAQAGRVLPQGLSINARVAAGLGLGWGDDSVICVSYNRGFRLSAPFSHNTHPPQNKSQNPGLLGLNYNRGQKILLRLRPHESPGAFMDMESILGCVLCRRFASLVSPACPPHAHAHHTHDKNRTMLHELVHNEISEHSDRFYTRLEGVGWVAASSVYG